MGRTTGQGWSRGAELGSAHPKLFTWGSLASGGFLRYHRTVFFVCLGVGCGGRTWSGARVGRGAPSPSVALGGTPRSLPCSEPFGRRQSVCELSARARARGARGGRGRAGPRAGPQPGPRPRASSAARSGLGGPRRPPAAPRTRPLALLLSLSGQSGGSPRPCRVEAGGRRVVRPGSRPPRHVLSPRRQQPLPAAPFGLEQRLPAAGEGAAGPGEVRGAESGSVRLFPEPRSALQLCGSRLDPQQASPVDPALCRGLLVYCPLSDIARNDAYMTGKETETPEPT